MLDQLSTARSGAFPQLDLGGRSRWPARSPPLDADREHGAEPPHLARGHGVAGMRRQAGIGARLRCAECRRRSLAEPGRAFSLGLTRTSSVRRPRSSSQASNGRESRRAVCAGLDTIPGLGWSSAGKRAGDHVGMSVEIFRSRVHHDVGAERERGVKHRRCHGRINGQHRAGRVRDSAMAAMSLIAQSGLGGRLDVDETVVAGFTAARTASRSPVSTKSTWCPNRGRGVDEPIPKRPIHHLRGDDMRPRRQGQAPPRSPPPCRGRTAPPRAPFEARRSRPRVPHRGVVRRP